MTIRDTKTKTKVQLQKYKIPGENHFKKAHVLSTKQRASERPLRVSIKIVRPASK